MVESLTNIMLNKQQCMLLVVSKFEILKKIGCCLSCRGFACRHTNIILYKWNSRWIPKISQCLERNAFFIQNHHLQSWWFPQKDYHHFQLPASLKKNDCSFLRCSHIHKHFWPKVTDGTCFWGVSRWHLGTHATPPPRSSLGVNSRPY